MRTTAVSKNFLPLLQLVIRSDTRPRFSSCPSLLSSLDSRHMDRHIFRIRSVHELVAERRVRDPELVTGTASFLRSSCTHHVLHRLVMSPPTIF